MAGEVLEKLRSEKLVKRYTVRRILRAELVRFLQDDDRACTREELLVELADFARNLDDIDAVLRKAASEGEVVSLGKRGLFKARPLWATKKNIDFYDYAKHHLASEGSRQAAVAEIHSAYIAWTGRPGEDVSRSMQVMYGNESNMADHGLAALPFDHVGTASRGIALGRLAPHPNRALILANLRALKQELPEVDSQEMMALVHRFAHRIGQHPEIVHLAMRNRRLHADLASEREEREESEAIEELTPVAVEEADSAVFLCTPNALDDGQLRLVVCWCDMDRWNQVVTEADPALQWSILPAWRRSIQSVRVEEGFRPARSGEERLVAVIWEQELKALGRTAILLDELAFH